ncbi:hypothetical protein Trydic_g16814 [Trypoxylus dichotomus]
MRSVIALLGLMACVSNAVALDCLLCVGSTESDCSRGDVSGMVVQRCENSLPALQNTTLSRLALPKNYVQFEEEPAIVTTCVAFAATNGGVTFVERGCGFIWEGVPICGYMETLIELLYCSNCDEDKCNFSPINV